MGALLVVSVCDGIGGIWAALSPLPVQWTGCSSEVNRDALHVLEKRFPQVEQLGDIRSITKAELQKKVKQVTITELRAARSSGKLATI